MSMHFPFLLECHGKPEKPVLVLRGHPMLFIMHGLVFVLLLIIPFIVPLIVPEIISDWITLPRLGPVLIMIFSLYMLVVLLLGFNHFFNWFFDIWVVTNERIIDIDQEGVFSRKIGELELHRVQDVVAESHGMLATIFHFGKITVETAGRKEEFSFDGLANPYTVSKKILELAREDTPLHSYSSTGIAGQH